MFAVVDINTSQIQTIIIVLCAMYTNLSIYRIEACCDITNGYQVTMEGISRGIDIVSVCYSRSNYKT